MPNDAPVLTRDEGLAVIADWLRNLTDDERSELSRALVNYATNSDADRTLAGVGTSLAPVLLRMDLGDDPRLSLPECLPDYPGGNTALDLRRSLDAVLAKATVMRQVSEWLRTVDKAALPELVSRLRDQASQGPPLPVKQQQGLERLAQVLEATTRGVDPLVAFETASEWTSGRPDGE